MRSYGLLLKLFLRTSLFTLNPPGAKKYRAAGYGLLIVAVTLFVGYSLFVALDQLFAMALPAMAAQSILAAILLSVLVFGLFLCMRSMMSAFSRSSDLPFLLALPVPPRAIFAARYTRIYMGQAGMMSLLLVPLFIAYCRHYGQGSLSWLMALVYVLLAPAIPLGLASLLSGVLTRLLRGRKGNETLTGLLGVALVGAFLVGFYYLMGQMESANITQEMMRQILTDVSQYARSITSGFPLVDWAAASIATPLPLAWQMLGFALPCALITLATLLFGGNYYAKYAVDQGSASSAKARGDLSAERHSSLFALCRQEFRGLLRSPLYAMNSLITIILGPIIAIFPLLMPAAFNIASLGEAMGGRQISVLIGLMLMSFISIVNPGLGTTISREGRNAYMLKVIPVTPGKQMAARILVGIAIAALGNLLVALIMPIAWPLSYGSSLLMALIATLAVAPGLILSTLPDLFHPKLEWESEQQAMKQNLNGVFCMLIALLALLPQIAIFALLPVGLEIAMLLSAGFSLLCLLALLFLYPKLAARAFARLS